MTLEEIVRIKIHSYHLREILKGLGVSCTVKTRLLKPTMEGSEI